MMIDQDLPDPKPPWTERHPRVANLAGIGIGGIIALIEAAIRIWSALERARQRKKQRDKETK